MQWINTELTQRHFLQTVMTGLHGNAICTDHKPYLSNLNISDETFLNKMSAVYSLEMGKKFKLSEERRQSSCSF